MTDTDYTLSDLLKMHDDIRVLEETGVWPNGEIPKWAKDLSEKYHAIYPASSAVLMIVYRDLAAKLREELESLQIDYEELGVPCIDEEPF